MMRLPRLLALLVLMGGAPFASANPVFGDYEAIIYENDMLQGVRVDRAGNILIMFQPDKADTQLTLRISTAKGSEYRNWFNGNKVLVAQENKGREPDTWTDRVKTSTHYIEYIAGGRIFLHLKKIKSGGVQSPKARSGSDRAPPVTSNGGQLPNFSGYPNTKAKKAAFFGYLLPLIRELNGEIMRDRKQLLAIQSQLGAAGSVDSFDERWLKQKAEEYEFQEIPERVNARFVGLVLMRVDIVAPSLVLAQAANESGWGTSRFARQGNNLFGMRAYDGSGLVPKRRGAGQTYTVAAYASPRASIEAYMKHLNTHDGYLKLRQIRAGQRSKGRVVSGYDLANGLGKYSERGRPYIDGLQAKISRNNLGQYDE